MLCKKCGANLGEDPKVRCCKNCGHRIDAAEKPAPDTHNPSARHSNQILGISAAIAIMLLILAGWYLKSNAKCLITVSNGECYIREGIFQKKEDLQGTIVIPPGTISIQAGAFMGCENIDEIVLNSSLRSIGDDAFSGCSGIKSIELPENLRTIGNRAFYECDNLTTVENMDRLLMPLGEDAFYETPFWNSIPELSGIQSISDLDASLLSNSRGTESFHENINNFVSVIKNRNKCQFGVYDGNYYVLNYDFAPACNAGVLKALSTNETIEIPAYIRDTQNIYKVDSVLNGAFAFSGVKNVSLPPTVTTIGSRGFVACENLSAINLPENLTNYGNNCFSDCSSLNNVVIPEGTEEIPVAAFRSCSSLTNISIPESVTTIGNQAFRYTPLRDNMLAAAGDSVYVNNILLFGANQPTITIKDGTTIIASDAFLDCDNVQTVNMPDSLVNIRPYAFKGCENLTTIPLENVTLIGDEAFSGCRRLRDIQISSLDTLGENVFKDCKALDSLTIPESLVSFNNNIFEGSGLNQIIIPSAMAEDVVIPSNIEIVTY